MGLLILRLASGAVLIARGVGEIELSPLGSTRFLAGVVALAAGTGLVLGFATLLSALASVLFSSTMALCDGSMHPDAASFDHAGLLVLVMVAALLLLGPGAYSIDARLFGRREITIPRD